MTQSNGVKLITATLKYTLVWCEAVMVVTYSSQVICLSPVEGGL